jgi:hypothetical protein
MPKALAASRGRRAKGEEMLVGVMNAAPTGRFPQIAARITVVRSVPYFLGTVGLLQGIARKIPASHGVEDCRSVPFQIGNDGTGKLILSMFAGVFACWSTSIQVVG